MSEWDVLATGKLRKLGKRDATTRLRALGELRKMVNEVDDDGAVGNAFLLHFGHVFEALCADGHPRARIEAVRLAGEVVMRFRGAAKIILCQIVPHWIALRGDETSSVAVAAVQSMDLTFKERRQGALAGYVAAALRDFCYVELENGGMGKIAAVIQWTYLVDGGTKVMAEFVDDVEEPLVKVGRGARMHCCRAVAAIIGESEVVVENRARMFGEIAVEGLRCVEGWELVIILVVRGWSDMAFGKDLGLLPDKVVEALNETPALFAHVVLPLLVALGKRKKIEEEAAVIGSLVERVLKTFHDALLEDSKLRRAQMVTVAMAYMECARYAMVKSVEKFGSDISARVRCSHVIPMAHAMLVGQVLAPLGGRVDRRVPIRMDDAQGVVEALAKTLAVMEDDDEGLDATAFVTKLKTSPALARRYSSFIRAMSGSALARKFANDVLTCIVGDATESCTMDANRAFLHVISDSLYDEALREAVASFAISHVEADAQTVGAILAWANLDVDDVCNRLMQRKDRNATFIAIAKMIEAHGEKQRGEGWTPMTGAALDDACGEARKNGSEAAFSFIATLLRVDGGACIGRGTRASLLHVVADSLRNELKIGNYVIDAALSDANALEFAAVVVGRRGISGVSVRSFVKNLPSDAWLRCAGYVLDELLVLLAEVQADEAVDDEEEVVKLGTVWHEFVDVMAAEEAAMVHALLMERLEGEEGGRLLLLHYVVEQAELEQLLKEGEIDALFVVFGLLGPTIREKLVMYIKSRPVEIRARIGEEAVRRMIAEQSDALLDIVRHVLSVDEDVLQVESCIATLIGDAASETSLNVQICALLARLVHVTVMSSKRRALDSLRNTLEKAATDIRRDASSRQAQFGAMLLGASLVPENDEIMAEHAQWLVELVCTALKAIRRTHERSGMLAGKKKQIVESPTIATGAILMANAIGALDARKIHSDEWRFWAMIVEDALLEAHTADANRRITQCVVANVANVATQLISAHETSLTKVALRLAEALPIRVKVDLLHWRAAWAATVFLPHLVDRGIISERAPVAPADPAPLATLAVEAVKRRLFIRSRDELPVAPDAVYGLIALLGASHGVVRRAAMLLIVRAARVALRLALERNASFTLEEEEAVKGHVPVQLRTALGEQGDEIAYFLAWRVFLELIIDERCVNEQGEDISFRRVGVAYLRTQEQLFGTFFGKCTRVIVHGSQAEEDAAAAAAQLVLRDAAGSSALPASEVAISTAAIDGEHTVRAGAAGAAFARALQRVPALSRRVGLERLSRADALQVEKFAQSRVSPHLIALEVARVSAAGAFEGDSLSVRGSVAGREVSATYEHSDASLGIVLQLPACFPLQRVLVSKRSATGMSQTRWRNTMLGITSLLGQRDASIIEAVELWRGNLDKSFEGVEECPICYSILHLTSYSLPKMKCGTCRNAFHSDCITKWFKTNKSRACPMCRSDFR